MPTQGRAGGDLVCTTIVKARVEGILSVIWRELRATALRTLSVGVSRLTLPVRAAPAPPALPKHETATGLVPAWGRSTIPPGYPQRPIAEGWTSRATAA